MHEGFLNKKVGENGDSSRLFFQFSFSKRFTVNALLYCEITTTLNNATINGGGRNTASVHVPSLKTDYI